LPLPVILFFLFFRSQASGFYFTGDDFQPFSDSFSQTIVRVHSGALKRIFLVSTPERLLLLTCFFVHQSCFSSFIVCPGFTT